MIIYGLVSSVIVTPRGSILIGGEPASVSGISYGKPPLEAAGVENRRFSICHPFTAEDVAALPAGLMVTEEMPADWRYPTN